MACNCKNDNQSIEEQIIESNDKKISIGSYILKAFLFLLLLVALPLINVFIIWFMFRTIVLNKDVNIKPILSSIGNKFRNNEEDDEIEYTDDLTDEDVVLVDVEDISK